ncbi:MAG: hypothetical protein V3V20_08375 [Algisphaera sp.]
MRVELDPEHASVVSQAVSAGAAPTEADFLFSLIDDYTARQKTQSEIDAILIESIDGPCTTYATADALRDELLTRFDARHRSKPA